MYILYFNVKTGFLQTSAARHLETLRYRKILTTYLNSKQKMQLGLPTLVRVIRKKLFCYPVY
jgi:hypothetical protein